MRSLQSAPSARSAASRPLHIIELPHLALALELGPVHSVQLHELPGQLHRLFPGADLDHGIATDDFLGRGERSVDDLELVAAGANPEPFGCSLEAGGVLQGPALEAFIDELAHGIHQRLGNGLFAVALGVLDQHEEFHRTSPLFECRCRSLPTRRTMFNGIDMSANWSWELGASGTG